MKRFCLRIIAGLALAALAGSFVFAGDLPELKFEKYELPNGLDVILHKDPSIPMVAVNIWYHVGSKNEKPGRTGFAHVFEHMMFQGSEHHNVLYGEAIVKIGGTLNGSTEEDRTNYWENVPSNYLETALWLEGDRMGCLLPAMTQERLDNQRDVIKNERRQGLDNQPYGKAEELLKSLMYTKDHPYSWSVLGSMADLSAASMEDISDFFRMYYAPNNASLCIAGDFDPAQAKAWVEKYFGWIPPGPPIDRLTSWMPTLNEVRRANASDNVNLARLYMVWPTPAYYAPGDAEFDLLASVLASGQSSRLYKTLVYDKQLAQDITCYQESRELNSTFTIIVTAKKGKSLEEIEPEIDRILKDICTNGVTAQELALARTGWETGFVRSLQQVGSFGGRADKLNAYNTYLGDPGKLLWDRDRYTKATLEGIKQYANKYLNLNGRGILYIQPRGELTAVADASDLTTPPGAAAEPSFPPPAIQKTTLSNGLEILLVERHDLPLAQVNLLVKSGWGDDPPARFNVCAMTSELLNKGTKAMNAFQISDEAQRLGANLATTSTYDYSSVTLNVLTNNLDPALKLMAEVVLTPTFPQDELDRQKDIYRGKIRQEAKQPLSLAMKNFWRELYGSDHPYAQPYTGSGTLKTIEVITRADLESFYKTHYLANNAVAVVVGDVTLAEAKAKLEKAFGSWKGGTVAVNDAKPVKPLVKTRICIIDKPGAAQSAIVLGNLVMPRSSTDFVPTSVVNQVLGGGSTSRLFMNLRQDKGYTYGANSFITSRRNPGGMASYAEVQTEVTKEAIVEFVKEIRGVAGDRPPTAQELTDSKDFLIKGFPQNFQTFGGVATSLGTIAVLGLSPDEWQTYVSRIGGVTPEIAAQLAKAYIHPDQLLIVIVGDRAKIEPKIRELNLGEITFPAQEQL